MAYSSIASLMRTIESVLTSNLPVQSLICDHSEEFLALREKVSPLEVFLKNLEKSNVAGGMTDLETQVKEVANAVEHTIQLRLTESVMTNEDMQKEKAHERLCDSLKQVAKEIDRVQEESLKIQDKGKQPSKEPLVQDSSSEKHSLNVENNMVGRDDQRKRLLAELTQYGGSSGELKVIPIIGMGGIGKTTLAKEVYDDAFVQSHFDVRAWATVSSQYNLKEILIDLLHKKGDTSYITDEAKLADMLQKSLKNRRYLIVLDDMWSSKAWDDIRLCFPSEKMGSRILLTTRDNNVACHASAENLSLQMGLMSPVESWNLFKSTVSANEALPSEFETIGKRILDKCHGLPLTIVVVAALLKSKRTIEDWENVAKDVKSITNDLDKQCINVLGLSYNHLTSDLKSCLLYFGIFPEDSEILVERLMGLWMAEGFLKLEKDLEGEAEKCLQDLIDRCLVLVSERSLNNKKIRSCKVHDLIYDLCLREAQRQTYFIMNDIVFYDEPNPVPPEYGHLSRHKMRPCERRTDDDYIFCYSYRALLTPGHHHFIRGQTDDDETIFLKRTRSIFSFSTYSSTFTLKSELIHFNLLRVLDLSPIKFYIFPPQILCLIWLRYLSLSSDARGFDIPPEICRLWNLQTFIVKGYLLESTTFPEQTWELRQLRYLRQIRFCIPNPPSLSVDEERHFAFSNVQTISGLSPGCCTKEVILGIQNVKKLGIYGDEDEYESFQKSRLFDNLCYLHQLETLNFQLGPCWMSRNKISPVTIPSAKAFPTMLKKLKLLQTHLRWEDLNIIGQLPNLEALKLKYYACKGQHWYPIVGGFTQLKLLLIESNKFKYWKATSENFPVLERLMIRSCYDLEEIPIEFAEIDSLQLIELKYCKAKLDASAVRIQQEQEEIGNKPVDVRIIE